MSKASLNELMGKAGEASRSQTMTLENLPQLLGEKMPKIEFTPVGRLRLSTALRNRFGDGFKNIPGIEQIFKEFDEEAKYRVKIEEMKMIKGKRG